MKRKLSGAPGIPALTLWVLALWAGLKKPDWRLIKPYIRKAFGKGGRKVK